MNNVNIHSTAIVSAQAKIGNNVEIGPFSIIKDDVEIGNDVIIKNNVLIDDGARIDDNCVFHAGAVISSPPQDLKYNNEKTYTYIGKSTVVREYATINRGTAESLKTTIGSDCLVMTYSHIAHDCSIGDQVIISAFSALGGHVHIQDKVILGGFSKIHQFCHVGKHSMVGADSKIVKDVPPFTLIGRIPPQVEGVNKIGLRRRGFERSVIKELERFYDTILFSGFNNRDGIAEYKKRGDYPQEVQDCIDFIENSTRGIHR
jgi:UDP-N-acetylglucosamine acyltransferase